MCILFVDDEFIIAMAAEDALRDAGHEVITAGHAADAIDLIARHPDQFTCLVTDLHMPGQLNGADLVAHVRGLYPVLPIVLATAMPHATTPVWRKRYRVELLDKPYSPKCLVQSVERLLHAVQPLRHAFWNAAPIELEGEIARKQMIPHWQNPYGFGTQEHDAWLDGWDQQNGRNRSE